jgi:hypothetical protein
MMPENRLTDLVQGLEGQLDRLRRLLRTNLGFAAVEQAVTASLDRVAGGVLPKNGSTIRSTIIGY